MQKFDLTSKTGILSMIASICSNNPMPVLVNLLKTLLTQNNTENQKKAIIEIMCYTFSVDLQSFPQKWYKNKCFSLSDEDHEKLKKMWFRFFYIFTTD